MPDRILGRQWPEDGVLRSGAPNAQDASSVFGLNEMAPSDQEIRCASTLCGYLCESTGHRWAIKCWLDEQYPNEKSPDVLLSDGRKSMAVEIKQLTDGPTFHQYRLEQHSLYSRLSPDRGRSYHLRPVLVGRTGLPGSWVPRVKNAIAEQAPQLQVGEKLALRIPRHSPLKNCGESNPGFVSCFHGTGRELRKVLSDTTGFFQLQDGCEPGHQFLTDETRTEFERGLARACIASKQRGSIEFRWHEEWWLHRLRDPPNERRRRSRGGDRRRIPLSQPPSKASLWR